MISEEEALAQILSRVVALPARRVSIEEARGCFVHQEVRAGLSLPIFDNSAMDGYALRAAETQRGARLRVIGEQPAGLARQLRVGAGETVRIFTGAPLPAGADAVVMQEETTREGEGVTINTDVAPGEFVRRRGGDVTEGQVILDAGEPLRPESLALLAAQGLAEVQVGGEALVALISTGDELARPGEAIAEGQIYESNSTLLRGLIEGAGARVISNEHVVDEPAKVREAFASGLAQDALIISGGVSVGDRDFVRPVLRELGVEIDLWRVAMKPGKPFLFGRARNCAVFGLPGNPVSAFVTFLLLVRPALLKMMGANQAAQSLPMSFARLAADLENEGDRVHYFRGMLREGVFTVMGRQESHALFGLSRSNSLLRLAPGEKKRADEMIAVLVWP